jgi:hypothetical protein
VVRNRSLTTIDERALNEEVAELMVGLRQDLQSVVSRIDGLMPYLLQAHRMTWESDIGLERYIGLGEG